MNVVFVQQRREVSLFGVFFVVILVVMVWKWVLLALGIITATCAAAWLVRRFRRDFQAAQRIEEGYRVRAAEQDAWVYQGDPRGMFGHDWRHDEGPVP